MGNTKTNNEEVKNRIFNDIPSIGGEKERETSILQQLTQRLSTGDRRALEQLYLMTYDSVTAFINSIVRSRDDASDLSQEVYMFIWENTDKLTTVRSMKGYLYAVARTYAFRFIRSRAAERGNTSLTDLPNLQVEGVSTDEIIAADEMKLLITLALEEMPRQRKEVFEMSRYENMSYDEIAQKLGITKRTVESHIYHVIRELKEIVYVFALFCILETFY